MVNFGVGTMSKRTLTMTLDMREAALFAVAVAQYIRRNKGQAVEIEGMALLAILSEAWKAGETT